MPPSRFSRYASPTTKVHLASLGSQDVLSCSAYAVASSSSSAWTAGAGAGAAAAAAASACSACGFEGRLLNNFNIVAIMKALLFI